ncbi:hypothetical protein AB0D57_17280 [Streptomyces sp. NPDC048275]|uniref:hypothetical protein n=1 Tax=Streptomyces sp. NPDC048275 TaxID=3155629 RepID=UPI0033FC611E
MHGLEAVRRRCLAAARCRRPVQLRAPPYVSEMTYAGENNADNADCRRTPRAVREATARRVVGPDHAPDHGSPARMLPERDRWSGVVAAAVVGVDG